MAENELLAPVSPGAPDDAAYLPTSWAELIDTEMTRLNVGPTKMAEIIDHPKVDKTAVSRWRKDQQGASDDVVRHTAIKLGIPVSLALRLAGHGGMAAYIERVAGGKADDVAALEPMLAQLRPLLEALPPEKAGKAEAAVGRFRTGINELLRIVKGELEELRDPGDQAQGRDAS